MTESLQCLGHQSIIGSDDEHNNIGDICTAGAHGGEGGVARGVDKRDRVAFPVDGVGPNALGDASGFSGSHLRATNGIQQGGLAVINVTHECDDWTAKLFLLGFGLNGLGRFDSNLLLFMDSGTGDALFTLKHKAIHVTELGGDFRLHGLVDVGEDLHPHQILDDLEGRNFQLCRQFLDLDWRLDMNDLAVIDWLWLGSRFRSDFFLIDRNAERGGSVSCLLADARKGLTRGGDAFFRRGFVDQRECRKFSRLEHLLLILLLFLDGRCLSPCLSGCGRTLRSAPGSRGAGRSRGCRSGPRFGRGVPGPASIGGRGLGVRDFTGGHYNFFLCCGFFPRQGMDRYKAPETPFSAT